MSGQWHPDAEALARYQAGRVRGFRDRRLAAHVVSCARCASVTDQLAAVSTVLASVPAPPMPDAVERQITAALAAEAANRKAGPAAASPAAAAGPAGAAPRKAAVPAAGGPRPRRHNFRPAMVFVSAAACLLLVGFGYLLSRTSSSSSSSTAASGAAASASGNVSSPEAAARVPASGGRAISPTDLVPAEEQSPRFLVVASGTKYEQGTLATQVDTELARNGIHGAASAGSGAAPSQSASAAAGSNGGSPPSRPLVGCVLHWTAAPLLVDRATYQGNAVYVIADAHHAWVVGRGCTAGNPELIATVPLPASG
jgi:hypothetical protein